MPIVSVILGIVSAVLLFLFLFQKLEIRSITDQLKRMRGLTSNQLVHSENGDRTTDALIREINLALRQVRDSHILYQQKNHDLEQMMTNISHDLRTPLTSALGYIDLLRHSNLPEDEKSRELEIVENRLHRLEELINSFFKFSQIISGSRNPDLEPVSLTAILEESIVHYYDDYCGRNREIVLHCDWSNGHILSNRAMLLRIFDNLIGNALKHGVGTLTVTADTSDTNGSRICFENEVTDPNMDIRHLFDEFYTTDISRTGGNAGLGLAIAKQFTQLLGGSIFADCAGQTFSVTVEFPAPLQTR